MAKYKHRIADQLLRRKVLGKGAVLIEAEVVRQDNYGKTNGRQHT